MRYGLLVFCVTACIGLYQGCFEWAYDSATTAALTAEARLAIDVRCPHREGRSSRECRSLLKRLYLAGTLDPDKTLRAYCDSVRTDRRGGRRPPPPELCVRRYGGW